MNDATEISTSDSCPAVHRPAETFTGDVSLKPLFDVDAARAVGAAEVSFTPCSRTAWHTTPVGRPWWSPTERAAFSSGAASSRPSRPVTRRLARACQ